VESSHLAQSDAHARLMLVKKRFFFAPCRPTHVVHGWWESSLFNNQVMVPRIVILKRVNEPG
jgi:hypothetical protein